MFNLDRISKEQESRRAELIAKARSQLDYIVATLKEQLHPSRVILFGSINEKDDFHEHSDIYIAVSDINEDRYFAAYGEILSKSYFPIDLIILDKAKGYLKEKILKTGKVVYERK